MSQVHQLAALMERGADGYVFPCPELDIASHGDRLEEARRNLDEAVQAFFETASTSKQRNTNEDPGRLQPEST
jgi:predicted RNase H-like HicB family nuclease